MRINNLIPENTEGFGGEKPPSEENSTSNAKKTKRETAVSQRLINFALHMYKQLTSEQRYTIFILLQNGTKKKDIAKAINVSPYTISREIKRNSGHTGHYNWETAQRNVVYRKRISIPNRISISERPVEADSRRFGDFEMDTIVGKDGHGAIVTLTERSTNMLLMRKLNKGKNAKELARTVIHLLAPFKGRVKSITTDNGTEFACHEMIAKSIGTKIYFADPYSSWQKGAIENVNGLIRQYIPKNTCFSNISQQQITKIMQKINTRPREKLNFSTPRECFYKKML